MNICFAKSLSIAAAFTFLFASSAPGQEKSANPPQSESTSSGDEKRQTLAGARAAGLARSSFREGPARSPVTDTPQPQLESFRSEIQPILRQACVSCHGPDIEEGNVRIDRLDPDLLHGQDVDWWLEVLAVLSNGEMPPADETELTDADRGKVIDWLSSEVQVASAVRRSEQGHSSFRRMTSYEYNYALQDLLGLPYEFAQDLPPDPTSEEGFENSSEMLQMSASQFERYRELSLQALRKATVRGPRPELKFWGVSMKKAGARMWQKYDRDTEKVERQLRDNPERLKRELEKRAARLLVRPGGTHFKNLETGQAIRSEWSYPGARYAWEPTMAQPEVPATWKQVAILPSRQKLIVELGDGVPDAGTLRVRVRASRASTDPKAIPSLNLEFGWQASNNSDAAVTIGKQDIVVDALPGQPRFYQWDVPLSEIYPRNPMRKTSEMGKTPSPSEYVRIRNSSLSPADVQIDYVEITAPVYDQWPPESHTRLFVASENRENETLYAREILEQFMPRAWRRPVSDAEIDRKLTLFARVRPETEDFQEAMIEVLATVLSSPRFLYLVTSGSSPASDSAQPDAGRQLDDFELATRLAMFLWCSTPDDELRKLAGAGELSRPDVLLRQTERMLADSRSRRFSTHFVRQWLGMQLLDFLDVDRKAYPQFDASLKAAMQEEPIAFFQEVLKSNRSVLDFIHSDFTMANERLARHYRIRDVYGNRFRKVKLPPDHHRGGLLTQAGLLAMNSDGKDSHPLKRGIWVLESLLNDPPPPPPPAVPEIDLADPEIAKLTLKQRIENHRNHAACLSCHAKIDPWGIAFENFDAIGSWRTQIGDKPVDATSLLFNRQELDGIEGLKRFLLANRQDQFCRAITHKMVTYALGRPLTFRDRAGIDQITSELRNRGDGLGTMVSLIVASDLFQTK